MEEINFTEILFNFAITGIAYCAVPVIILIIKNKFEDDNAKKIAIINSIIIFILFTVYHLAINDNAIANIMPAIIYGFVNYCILKKNNKYNKDKTNQWTKIYKNY